MGPKVSRAGRIKCDFVNNIPSKLMIRATNLIDLYVISLFEIPFSAVRINRAAYVDEGNCIRLDAQ